MTNKRNGQSTPPCSDQNDEEFIVTAEMMIDGEDYENTLDEEEELEDEDEDELADLQKESELPLEELIHMYYGNPGSENENADDTSVSKDDQKSEEDKMEDETSRSSVDGACAPIDDGDSFLNLRITRGLAALNSQYFDEDYSSDEDYQPTADDWKKEIQIGEEHQAEVPVELSPYKLFEKTYDIEDKLLWNPNVATCNQLHRYLSIVYKLQDTNIQTVDRDDEQALFTLLQMRDVEKALTKCQEQEKTPSEVSLWSEEECQNFEQGLRVFGKDFRLIQKNKVQSRSIGEIVEFYYLWKKTERHDAFVTQTRLGRRKYTLPGIADMMGRFIEESDSMFSSRSESPNNYINNADIVTATTNTTTTTATPVNSEFNERINVKQENSYANNSYNNYTNDSYCDESVNYDRTIKQNNSSVNNKSWRTSPKSISIESVN